MGLNTGAGDQISALSHIVRPVQMITTNWLQVDY